MKSHREPEDKKALHDFAKPSPMILYISNPWPPSESCYCIELQLGRTSLQRHRQAHSGLHHLLVSQNDCIYLNLCDYRDEHHPAEVTKTLQMLISTLDGNHCLYRSFWEPWSL
jgi:hypothetical protein